MNEYPLVAIVTPSLNQGQFIRATIDSVLAQDYPNLVYWVIDGGSKDGTLEILQSYGDRLRWVSEPDGGQSQAINKGWQLTTGEIVSWLNADDLLAADAVSHAVKAMLAHPEIGGVYGNCLYISEDGAPIKQYPAQPYDRELLIVETENFIPQPGTFLRREVLERGHDALLVLEGGVALKAKDRRNAQPRVEVGILAVGLLDAAPADVAGDVDHGRE